MPAPSWNIPTVFEVYSIGDAEVLASAFNGLAMITASDSFGSMLRMAFLVGILGFAAKVVFTGKFDAIPLLASILMYFVMFAPRATVVVADAFSAAAYPVANVPIGIAAPFSIVSKTGKYFAETFETAFAVLSDESSFMGAGYLDALTVLLQMRDVDAGTANTNGSPTVDIQKSVVNYLVDCVHYDIGRNDSLFPPTVSIDRIRNEPITWDALQTGFVNIYTRQFLEADGPEGTDRSCSNAYVQLTPLMTPGGTWQSTAFEGWLKKVLQKGGATALPPGGTATAKIEGAVNAIGIAGGSGAQFAINSFLATMLRMSDNKMQIAAGSVQSAVIQSQAENARNVQWTGERTMFEKVARPVTAFIEIFLVAATPLMAFAIAAFGMAGVQTLGKFLMLHFWVALWTPTLAIANLYCITRVNRYVEYITSASETVNPISPLSLYGIDTITQKLQTEFATGSMLAAATPMLTLLLIYGSSQVASVLAGKMSSASEIDAKVAAPSVMAPAPVTQMMSLASGNHSVGFSKTGEAIMSLSGGQTNSQSIGALRAEATQTTGRIASLMSRAYGSKVGAGEEISWNKSAGWTNAGGGQNAVSASLNLANIAGKSTRATAAETMAVAKQLANRVTGSAGFDLKAGLPGGIGPSANAGWSTADISEVQSSAGVSEARARELLAGVSTQAQKSDTQSATLTSTLTTANSKVKSGKSESSDSDTSEKRLSEEVAQLASITKQIQETSMVSSIANSSVVASPRSAYNALSQAYRAQGKNIDSEVDSQWKRSFMQPDRTPQEAANMREEALARVIKNPALINDFAGNPEKIETAAKIAIMAGDANARMQGTVLKPLVVAGVTNDSPSDSATEIRAATQQLQNDASVRLPEVSQAVAGAEQKVSAVPDNLAAAGRLGVLATADINNANPQGAFDDHKEGVNRQAVENTGAVVANAHKNTATNPPPLSAPGANPVIGTTNSDLARLRDGATGGPGGILTPDIPKNADEARAGTAKFWTSPTGKVLSSILDYDAPGHGKNR